ncbi:AAA family ATPase [Flammeovirga kamogawensis]|uniref:AAA family ATPase n=1 Tax=Flammeovirga kamogawensis TaxID=373891 RepID=UPI001181FD0B|nr:MoxR family ATPase [Flammeovirga kamogawensis]MBB6461469.1 MoxR-like ATPase [Flammeovirga kamogawensis]TRX68191.1 MoxR family ATPase [Flammeovirga kamogawensis]
MSALESIKKLQDQISKSIIGQEQVVNRIIACLISDGNLLLEGLPGLAKTRAINSLAQNMDLGLSRVQFTPDLLPSDITGTEIYQSSGEENFIFQKGPIFNNLILADEINRAPAKVQSALLEAMQERQVTVAGTTYKLPQPFFVMATQNPIEQEGTYPLPEAQMDRFLMHVIVDYPSEAAELEVLRLVRSEEKAEEKKEKKDVQKLPKEIVFDARAEVQEVHVSEAIEKYIVALVYATRTPEKYSEDLAKWIDVGCSPRATIALDKVARVQAWLNGRDFVKPEDIQAVIKDIFRHRIVTSFEANALGITKEQIIDELISKVAVA